ncbi:alpha-amylase family glycosyl hydrolase [Mycoplasmopsis pulmonis]|nr:alpha-amylase family glycosyl hydrolase [Mycoplasmopsis pulmonis]VEU68407.1 Pullulanase [Mycoplasmopsis pulmonis]
MIYFRGIKKSFAQRIDYIDKNFATNAKLGIWKKDKNFIINFWQPFALSVDLIIYDKLDNDKVVEKINFVKKQKIWQVKIPLKFEDYYYHIKVQDENKKSKLVLDPYAKSLSVFNWEGKTNKTPKAAIIDWQKHFKNESFSDKNFDIKKDQNLVIYEMHIRDFSSLVDKKLENRKGTFKAAQECQIFSYLKKLGITHIQLLPVQSIYTLDDSNLEIIEKGNGQKWSTNYNWGYDPLNYFSLAGWYFSKPEDPSNRIIEFRDFIEEAHKNGIAVIMDVVYNHMMTNMLMNNILKDYFFRENSQILPVDDFALNTESKMVRKLIIDSLVYFVEYFKVDGFRFDLSTFIDKKTLNLIFKKLKKINPNIILHGEAWEFSDLNYENSYTKGTNTNSKGFAYFNDTTRNAIKGSDDLDLIEKSYGLIQGNLDYFDHYLFSIVGNVKKYPLFQKSNLEKKNYHLFSKDYNMNLQYSACHDGFSLWDKIITTTNKSFSDSIKIYRQALMMQFSTQGKQLILAGTEFCHSKPTDFSGYDSARSLKILNSENNLVDKSNFWVNENSYKTSDYTNGLKWQNLNNDLVKKHVFNFLTRLIHFYKNSNFFKLDNNFEKVNFLKIKKGFVFYEIQHQEEKLFIAHNFSNENIYLKELENKKILFNSDFDDSNDKSDFWVLKNSSIIFQ